jgi:uncharacterized protein YwgA
MTFAQNINEGQIEKVVNLIKVAGGQIVGRTRLQKMVYLLESAGFIDGFEFEYRHYGPFSEDVANAVFLGQFEGVITEEERPASWGGFYSIYRATGVAPTCDQTMLNFIALTSAANPVALELAATAVYLANSEREIDAWERTAQLKPEKTQYLDSARALYSDLVKINSVRPLPTL